MVKIILPLVFIALLFSCKEENTDAQKDAYLGGEVLNPISNYILLFKDNILLDTVLLDTKNYFSYKIKDARKGLYSFKHGEFQVFYIEPGDSLLIRANTIDFDESLAFTGDGAAENNFLMELFLKNEDDNTLVSTWYTLPPEEYELKLDSLKNIAKTRLTQFTEHTEVSPTYLKIANANLDYNFFAKKERYLTVNSAKFRNDKNYLPESFLNYRKDLSFGNENLNSYYPYTRFLDIYFDNLAYETYAEKAPLDKKSFLHNYAKIELIENFVVNDTLKNNMLRAVTSMYLINGKDAANEEKLVELFLKANSNQTHQREIIELFEMVRPLTIGNKIPDVALVGVDNKTTSLQNIIVKHSVLFFWSSISVNHYKSIHSKVAELKSKFPEYDFIGINTDTHFKKWVDLVVNSEYDIDHEFQLDDTKDGEKKLLLNSMNKAFILNKNGIILEGNTNITKNDFEAQLLSYLNK